MRYKGFLSYKHGDDDALAESLEKSLEKFAKPTFKRRTIEIFRDGNDLSAAADLGEKIRGGLENSEYFICMASPKYAQSKWCKREVDYWVKNKSIDNFLIVLTDGEINWDDNIEDFDWATTSALPDELKGAFKGTPFFIDFRNAGPKKRLNLDNPDFKTRLVLLAATLHEKSVGDMVGEALKQHKRTLKIRNAAIGILSLLLLVAVASAFMAVKQKNKALLSTYIANSQGQFDEDPTKALRLAEHAYNFAKSKDFPTDEATEQLIKIFYSGYGFYQGPSSEMMGFPEEEIVANKHLNNPAYQHAQMIIDSIYGTIPNLESDSITSKLHFDASTDSAYFIVSSVAMGLSKIFFIDNDTTKVSNIILPGFNDYTGEIQDIKFSKNGKYALLGSENGKTAFIENEAYRNHPQLNVFKDRAILKSSDAFPVRNVTFLNGGEFIRTESLERKSKNSKQKDKKPIIYYYKTLPFPYIEMHNTNNNEGTTSLDGQHQMVLAKDDAEPYAWFHYEQSIKTQNGDIIAEFPDAKIGLVGIKGPNGNFTISYQGIFNAHNDLLMELNLDKFDNPGILFCFSKDGDYVKVSYLNGLQRIFPLNPELIIERINNTKIMGHIAKLNANDKERFLIN